MRLIGIVFLMIVSLKASEAQCYEYMEKLLKTELQDVSMLSVGKDLYDSTLISIGLVLGQCAAYERMRDKGILKDENSLSNKTYDDFAFMFFEARKIFFNGTLERKKASNE